MRTFAEDLDWVPSYEPGDWIGPEVVSGHLVVEHGLNNAAAISFLKGPTRAGDVRPDHLRSILSVSYNNLIEWHLVVSSFDARWLNNLTDVRDYGQRNPVIPLDSETLYSRVSYSALAQTVSESEFTRTIRSCDEALIRVISRWKSLLKSEFPNLTNRNISTFFNALIFVRGCEDSRISDTSELTRLLITELDVNENRRVDIAYVLSKVLEKVGINQSLSQYIEVDQLHPFNALDIATIIGAFKDMYSPQDAGYDFNFALMSKHAMSRIYEKYVAIFSYEEDIVTQSSFFPDVPKLTAPSKIGAIYTPQFIASFFARFLRDNLTPRVFRDLRSIDPACGSGLFLRSLLELQCDPLTLGVTSSSISYAFGRAEGIDKDINACEATRLSLALLHLIVTGRLPTKDELMIRHLDSIASYQAGAIDSAGYGAIISNPPYIKLDHLPAEVRKIYQEFLGSEFSGRMDAYIPFVDLCFRLIAPEGIVCLVPSSGFLDCRQRQSASEDNSRRVRCTLPD